MAVSRAPSAWWPSSGSSAASCGDRRDRVARTWASTSARSSSSARSIRPNRISAAIQRIGRSGHQPRRDAEGPLLRADARRSARMRRGGARDSPRPSRRSRNSDRMPGRRGAADRRDRRRRRRDRRGRPAARCCAARTTSPISTRGALRPSARTDGGRVAGANPGRGAENFLRSRQRARAPAARRAAGRDHLGRHDSRNRQSTMS